jgi:hypothetical protein
MQTFNSFSDMAAANGTTVPTFIGGNSTATDNGSLGSLNGVTHNGASTVDCATNNGARAVAFRKALGVWEDSAFAASEYEADGGSRWPNFIGAQDLKEELEFVGELLDGQKDPKWGAWDVNDIEAARVFCRAVLDNKVLVPISGKQRTQAADFLRKLDKIQPDHGLGLRNPETGVGYFDPSDPEVRARDDKRFEKISKQEDEQRYKEDYPHYYDPETGEEIPIIILNIKHPDLPQLS